MQGVVGVIVIAALVGMYAITTPTPKAVVVPVVGTAGIQAKERAQFNYVAPHTEEVQPILAPTYIAPVVKSQKIVSAPAVQAAPQVPAAPQQDPAVAACLGLAAGSSCVYDDSVGAHTGTCITPAWRPLTCDPH